MAYDVAENPQFGASTTSIIATTRPGAITGEVTDADTGAAIADATVTADGQQATTDGDGTYTIEDLDAGAYDVTAEADGYQTATNDGVTIDEGETATVDFALDADDPEPGAITGEVTDADTGAAIADATVTADGQQATTDGDGTYTIEDLDAGAYDVTAEADGYGEAGSENVEVVADETTPLDFALMPDMQKSPYGLSRVAGANRFETAARLSATTFAPGVDVAYVAMGGDFADALTGGVAAGLDQAPVLLVSSTSIPDATADELDRLDANRIVILGGTSAVAPNVASQLSDYTDGEISRLAGPDRFATAAAVSRATFSDADTVYIVTGGNFPDGLAGTPAAVQANAPLLLVTSDGLPGPTGEELARLDPDDIVILGGDGVVGPEVAAELNDYGQVQRIAGPDRFATAARVAGQLDGPDKLYVATGGAFADALTAGAVAGGQNAPVLLVTSDGLPRPTAEELARLEPGGIVVMGGTAAVNNAVYSQLNAYLE